MARAGLGRLRQSRFQTLQLRKRIFRSFWLASRGYIRRDGSSTLGTLLRKSTSLAPRTEREEIAVFAGYKLCSLKLIHNKFCFSFTPSPLSSRAAAPTSLLTGRDIGDDYTQAPFNDSKACFARDLSVLCRVAAEESCERTREGAH